MRRIKEESEMAFFWGEGGRYGPFPIQKSGSWEGWPDFGKVMRHFREKSGYDYHQFADLYQRAIQSKRPVTRRQIERMELENEVPLSINRRKIITDLLNIPPALFGLAVIEDITLRSRSACIGQTPLQRLSIDTDNYKKGIYTLWLLHSTSQACERIGDINNGIQDLEYLISQAQGNLLYCLQEFLFSYSVLAANVIRDQQNFTLSHYYANQSVRVAKAMEDTDLIATALYTRGETYLEWGMFGTRENEIFQIQLDRINKAIRDFEEAKHTPRNGEAGLHPQLIGRIKTHLCRTHAVSGKSISTSDLAMLDDAGNDVGKQTIDDPYDRVLVTGRWQNFTLQGYHNQRAAFFNASGQSALALKEINIIDALRRGTSSKDLTRLYAWQNIVKIEAFIGLKEFGEAVRLAKEALLMSRDINSRTNIVRLVDIHGRLLQSSYQNTSEVREFGDMISIVRREQVL